MAVWIVLALAGYWWLWPYSRYKPKHLLLVCAVLITPNLQLYREIAYGLGVFYFAAGLGTTVECSDHVNMLKKPVYPV
jgi:hypothetical protein